MFDGTKASLPPTLSPCLLPERPASSHKLQHETDADCRRLCRGRHPPWLGRMPGLTCSLDPGPCHVPLWGITSASNLGKTHWCSHTTPCSTDRASGAREARRLAQGHTADQGLSQKAGLDLRTSTPWLESLHRAAWEVGSGGWCGGGKGELGQGAARAKLGGLWEEPSRQAWEERRRMLTLSGHFLRMAPCLFPSSS